MVLGISVSWEEWRKVKRENKRAKARSDEIDRQIEEEAKTFKKCDVLLMGLWPFTSGWYYCIRPLALILSLQD